MVTISVGRLSSCQTCANPSSSGHNLKMHMIAQAQALPMQTLKTFVLKHTCDYAISRADNFRTHLKNQSGEKSNKCNQCDFASSRGDVLKTHFKKHSGERSNKCNQCDFASSRPVHLRQHLKMHSGKKSNECNQCDFSCSDRNF